jgi:uncharacterized membrane-anchored protein YjiN (DUF445 family)
MGRFVARLKNDAAMRSRIEVLKRELLDSAAVRRYVEALWTEFRAWVQSDVEKDDSVIHAQALALVRFVGQKLDDDRAVQDFINEQILEEAPSFVRRYRDSIGGFIEDQIHSWTTEKLVVEFERAIGPDLQYIRINGTVVGAAVGLAIHSLTELALA